MLKSNTELPGLLNADPPLNRRLSLHPGFHASQTLLTPTGLGVEFHPSGVLRAEVTNVSLDTPFTRKLGEGVDSDAGDGVDSEAGDPRVTNPRGVTGVCRDELGTPGDGELDD